MVATRSKRSAEPEPRKAPPRRERSVTRSANGAQEGGGDESAAGGRAERSFSRRAGSEGDDEGGRGRKKATRKRAQELAPVEEERAETPQFHSATHFATRRETAGGIQLEAQPVDLALAFETMPDLDTGAEKLFKLLLSGGDMETTRLEIMRPGSAVSRRLTTYEQSFAVDKAVFGSQEYVSPTVIQDVLQTGEYNPVLYKANMAIMVVFFYTCQTETEKFSEDLKCMERSFPRIIGQELDQETFQLALDLRTHTAIAGMMQSWDNKDFDPMDNLNHFFGDRDDQRGGYRGWGVPVRYDRWRTVTARRVQDLVRALGPDAFDAFDETKLRRMFNWDEFATRMVNYIRRIVQDPDRKMEVAAALEAARKNVDNTSPADAKSPPKDVVVEVFDSGAGSAVKYPELPAQLGATSGKITKPKKDGKGKSKSRISGGAGLAIIRALEKPGPPPIAATKDSQRQRSITPAILRAEIQRISETGDDGDAGSGMISAEQYVSSYHKLRNEQNKENRAAPGPSKPKGRFIDRQEGAVRIKFDSQEDEELQEIPPPLPPPPPTAAQKGKKRALPQSDDEEFVQDDREDNPDRRKRSRQAIEALPRPQAVERARSEAAAPPTRRSVPQNELVPSNIGLPSRSRSISLARNDEGEGPTSMTELLQEHNKTILKSNGLRTGARRGRVMWTSQQSDALIDAIKRYGPNWAGIVNLRDPFLQHKTNVQLKDRARNLKIQFLKGGLMLPAGFRNVTLSEKDRQMLWEDYGINVAAKEEECPDEQPGVDVESDEGEETEEEL